MKINEPQRIGAVNPYQKQTESRSSSANSKRRTDQVHISAEAQEMLSSSQTKKEERADRVNDLKKEVASGTYHVDAGKIAEKLWPFLK
ncbi:flagellar biosynthesis anti-sigma factor FlgM [Paenibacillus sp. sptzw28]|uniref:flagellar biosynthesis anti-sigma factor FlgM n=1 Tax=Paenibacillus sp. sptzw28 TaxID=715179 RepID=UPI001C6F4033|nr:flagellar biosynthesis anti-sigma factor FlgM [Paenibacillus sp. sptzw28]QYR22106.1 flagellar biosynthesis anti-sigma factor FlgM [Paenibacillus sp. sptzw28]